MPLVGIYATRQETELAIKRTYVLLTSGSSRMYTNTGGIFAPSANIFSTWSTLKILILS